jgi:sugar-phosphatase
MPVFSCSAILFDLDGVLVDSTEAVEREWREWAQRKGVDADALLAISHGRRTAEVIGIVAPHLDAVAEAREIEQREAHDLGGVTAVPGAAKLIEAIPDGRWGVVTSGPRYLQSGRLKSCGLPVPKVFITADDVVHGKPHPEPYLKGAAALGFLPGECVVIEDAPAGIAAARAAGIRVIALASTYAPEKLTEADAVVRRLTDLKLEVREDGLLNLGFDSSFDSAKSREKPGIASIRVATESDRATMLPIINSAFAIETFLEGHRTSESQLAEMMQKGEFLLGLDSSGRVVGSVYVEVRGARGYFGMLAIDPHLQGTGLGRAMVEAAEQYCRAKGCTAMDLTVLSLRPELPPYYRKLGYAESGVEEFRPARPLKDSAECHCIVMSKTLERDGGAMSVADSTT